MSAKKDTAEVETIPLPNFDRDAFTDRGYYIVSQFQDEKRRRDRAAAVEAARRHPNYVCLMTPDNRLLHRNIYRREHLHLFLELHNLVSTWKSPQFFIMGYPIEIGNLLDGVHCYQRMGSTCNTFIDADVGLPTYLGCPRASISLKYLHPRAWYSLNLPAEDNPRRFVRPEPAENLPDSPPSGNSFGRGGGFSRGGFNRGGGVEEEGPEILPQARTLGELRKINRQYCGCPLIHVQRLEEIFFKKLPEEITAGEGIWRIAPDVMGEKSLQPRGKEAYYAFLREVGLGNLPSSEDPDAGRVDPEETEDDEDEEPEDLTRRQRMLAKYTWLMDE